MQKKLLLVLVLFFMTSAVCLSAPNYDPNKKPVIYDSSYNIALRKKLEDDYDKKYATCDDKGCVYNAPLGAYGREVQYQYDINKKNWQDTVIDK